MEKNKKKKLIIIIGIILFLIVIDQVTKIVFYQDMQVIPNVLKFTKVQNTGGAFGVGQNSTLTFIITNIIVLGIIIRFMMVQQEQIDKKTYFALCLIIAGGVGNLIDRIVRGYVVDFIDFSQVIKFPVFNIADCYIVIGWIMLAACFAAYTYRASKKRGEKIEKI